MQTFEQLQNDSYNMQGEYLFPLGKHESKIMESKNLSWNKDEIALIENQENQKGLANMITSQNNHSLSISNSSYSG